MSPRILPNETTSPQPLDAPLAAIYARVSTQDQADKGYSLPSQIEACQELALQHGYSVPESHIFQDDYTGTSLNRPQLARLRDLGQQRLLHAVIVYDLDRLSRKLAHQLLLTEEFEQAAVVLHIVSMPHGAKTPETQLFDHMRGVFAEYERAKILERTARGRRARSMEGYVPCGGATFGYIYVKHAAKGEHYDHIYHQCSACGQKGDKGACYAVHPEQASLVQRIFRLYVDSGKSLQAIAAMLTEEGICTPKNQNRTVPAKVWRTSTVANILHNTCYIGTLYDNKTQRIGSKSNPDKKTRHRRIPMEEWIPIAVPTIVEQAMFDAAQAQLIRNKSQSKRNRKHAYLLINGRLKCGQCGGSMSGEMRNPWGGRYRCYRAQLRYLDVLAPHSRRAVLARAIEPVAWQAVEDFLNNPAKIAVELERQRDGTSTQQADLDRERQHYHRQLTQCDKDLKRWEAAYLGEAIDLSDFKNKKAEVDARRASAEQELARLHDQQCRIEQATLETASLMEYCARVRSELHPFTLEEKRRALEALNITVIWHPEQPLTIRARPPVDIVSSASQCPGQPGAHCAGQAVAEPEETVLCPQ